jgi:hypothetical protein
MRADEDSENHFVLRAANQASLANKNIEAERELRSSLVAMGHRSGDCATKCAGQHRSSFRSRSNSTISLQAL